MGPVGPACSIANGRAYGSRAYPSTPSARCANQLALTLAALSARSPRGFDSPLRNSLLLLTFDVGDQRVSQDLRQLVEHRVCDLLAGIDPVTSRRVRSNLRLVVSHWGCPPPWGRTTFHVHRSSNLSTPVVVLAGATSCAAHTCI